MDRSKIIFTNEAQSVLSDEFIAHRLGLIPLTCKDMNAYSSGCLCGSHCKHCAAYLSLSISCDSETRTVSSRDLCCPADLRPVYESDEDPGVAIVKLGTGQRLNMSMVVKKGTGRMHAKWIPVTAVSFSYTDDDIVKLGVETSGSLAPVAIVRESLAVLRGKLMALTRELKQLRG